MSDDFPSYPADHVVFTIDGDMADQIVGLLTGRGHDEDNLKVLCCEDAAKVLDSEGEGGGPIHKLKRFVARLSDEHRLLQRVQSAVDDGAYAIAVPVDDDNDKKALAELLRPLPGVRHLSYVGSLTVEDLMVGSG